MSKIGFIGLGIMGMPMSKNLKKAGFDRVYDTLLSADLTVMEEAAEFLERLRRGERLPLFTSCCPAWVKFCEDNYPALRGSISTCRSPQQMLGAVIREQFRVTGENAGKRLVSVSVMPCTAKKAEILRRESHTGGVQDIDFSITTSELLELLCEAGISAADCPEAEADAPFSGGSGGAGIFGLSGGVAEAVLRYISHAPGAAHFSEGGDGVRRCRTEKDGKTIRIAVVSGLGRAKALVEKILRGEEDYELVEVMACPGGCVMGGGQPADIYEALRDCEARSEALHTTDRRSEVRCSQDNPRLGEVLKLISGSEHRLLHRNFE